MISPIHLEKVSERFIIELFLKLERSSPLHIGAGSEGVEKILLKFHVNGKEVPIIPAESIKGVLRSLAFSISRQMFPNNLALKYHTKDKHVGEKELGIEDLKRVLNLEKITEYLKRIMPKDVIEEILLENELQLFEYYLALNCPICKLFGAQSVAGKLTFSDGIPNFSPALFKYAATSINRKTRIVEEERLFSVTAVKPEDHLRYKVRIVADNVHRGSEEAKLLSVLLQWILRFGLQIGGLKSYGYGRLHIDENETVVRILKFNREKPIDNIRALLLKKGYFQEMKIREFTMWLD